MADEEKKIIIDEGWKGQVEREKEEARRKLDEQAPQAEDGEAADQEGLPEEATFESLVGTLASQTMFALGLLAVPGQEQVMVDLDQAKFSIDLLAVLRDKTKGNLEPKEEGAITEALGELQRVYVARVQQFQEQAMKEAGVDLGNLKGP